MSLTKKRLGECAWNLADLMDIDSFDQWVVPLIDEICKRYNWDYAQIIHKQQERDAAARKQPQPLYLPRAGYSYCLCRDCMEIAVSSNQLIPELCSACASAGCEADHECRVENDDG